LKPLLHQDATDPVRTRTGLDGSLRVSPGEKQVEGQGPSSRRITGPGFPVLPQQRWLRWLSRSGERSYGSKAGPRRNTVRCFAGIRLEGQAAPPPEPRSGISGRILLSVGSEESSGGGRTREERASARLLWKGWRVGDRFGDSSGLGR
jgi:hypothetical protein